MRRFSLIMLTLIALCYIFLPRSEHDTRRLAAASTSATADDEKLLTKLDASAPAGAVMNAAVAAGDQAPLKPEGGSIAASAPPTQIESSGATPASAAAGAEVDTPAHTPSSAKADAIDPVLSDISEGDLATVAQGELAKLGCYDGAVDGVWGSKSRAAVAAFNERIVGSWSDEPSRKLIEALRSAPAGVCKQTCADGVDGGQCIAASKGKAASDSATDRDLAYLPPWMRGEKTASAAPDAVAVEAGATTTAASTATPPDRETLRSAYDRRAERYDRRWSRRSQHWMPEGWPASAH